MGGSFVGAYAVLIAAAFIIAVLWVILPFAVFGIKPLAREIIEQQKKTNELLQDLVNSGRGR